MLYCEKIDVSEGINVNETRLSKEYIICHYWHVLDIEFAFQSIVCNGFNDVLMMSSDISSIAFLNIFVVDYSCIIVGITKSEAINLLRNADLSAKSGSS